MTADPEAAGRFGWSSWLPAALWFLCGALAGAVVLRFSEQWPSSSSAAASVATAENSVPRSTGPEPVKPPDHEAELNEALATLNSTARAESLRRLGRELANDPARGMALAARIVNFDDRAEFLRAFVHAWAAHDSERALSYALSQPPGLLRGDSVAAACGGWATVNPQAAAAWAREQVTGPTRTRSLARIAESWASVDPAAASAWAAGLPSGVLSEAALRQCLNIWANQDPAAAAAWITDQPEGRQRDVALLQLAADWASQEPQACAEWVARRAQTHDDAESLAESLASLWSSYDAPAASAWIASLPQGEARQAAAVMAATTWVHSDPAAATAWVDSLTDLSLKNQLTLDMAGTWASIDPEAALAYAQARVEPSLQQETMREVFDSWAMVDSTALDRWLADRPADETTDLARDQLAVTRFANDPAGALATAAGMAGEESRRARMESLFASWAEKNRPQARAWLRDAEVPAPLRPRLEKLASDPEAADED